MSKKAVVISGASTGIGRACALYLAGRDYLVLAGVRREQDAQALRQSGGKNVQPLLLDVCDQDSISKAALQVSERVGEAGLSGLVNNAGIALGGPLEFVELDDLRRQLEINVVGLVACTQAFLESLRVGNGRIVNMGSVSGRMATPFMGPYAASKFAVEALTASLRVELRPWGIHVAVIEPGSVATPIWDKGAQLIDELKDRMPARAQTLYGQAITSFEKIMEKTAADGIEPELVARAVEHALDARRPRARYLVGGLQTKIQARIDVLPFRLRDALVVRALGLDKEAQAR